MRAGIQKLEYNYRESSIVLLEFSWAYEPAPYLVLEPADPYVYRYALYTRVGTSGTWYEVGYYVSDGSGTWGQSFNFLAAQQWKYEHETKTNAVVQYYFEISDVPTASILFTSNTLTVERFGGWGSKLTRLSEKSRLKQQQKTRKSLPKF